MSRGHVLAAALLVALLATAIPAQDPASRGRGGKVYDLRLARATTRPVLVEIDHQASRNDIVFLTATRGMRIHRSIHRRIREAPDFDACMRDLKLVAKTLRRRRE